MSVFVTDIQKLKPLLIKYLYLLMSRLAQMAKVELSNSSKIKCPAGPKSSYKNNTPLLPV